jgi:hypothetical protein
MGLDHLKKFVADTGLVADWDFAEVTDDMVIFVHVPRDDVFMPDIDVWLIEHDLITVSCVSTYKGRVGTVPNYGEVYGFTAEQHNLAVLFKLTFCG